MRVRVCTGEKLHNAHILTIATQEKHTGEYIFDAIRRLPSVFMGRVGCSVTRLEQFLPPGVYRVWCSANQLNLAVQSAFDRYVKEIFQDLLHSLIVNHRRQTNL